MTASGWFERDVPRAVCSRCGEEFEVLPCDFEECRDCDGTGDSECMECNGDGVDSNGYDDCWYCDGSGRNGNCGHCEGAGVVQMTEYCEECSYILRELPTPSLPGIIVEPCEAVLV